jgi:mono/diheme cytochrome c family protein
MSRGIAAGLGLALAFIGFLHAQGTGASPAAAAPGRPERAAARSVAQVPTSPAATPAQAVAAARPVHDRALIQKYCSGCHNDRLKTAGLDFGAYGLDKVAESSAVWEKVVWKLRGGIMPPLGRPRPDAASIDEFATWVEGELDRVAAASPEPGRVPNHRLNRAEYTNAIRDILSLDLDGKSLLPPDDSGHGFDNMAGTLALTPSLLERYMSAARRISRLAVGDPTIGAGFTSKAYQVPINLTQDDRMSEDLPFGSRAGVAVRHLFPLDGEYEIKVALKRSVYEYIVNLEEEHDLDVRVDGRRVERFRVGGAATGKPAPLTFSGTFMAAGGAGYPTQDWDDYMTSADANLHLRIPAKAGVHVVGVSFVGKSWEKEGIRQPPLREYGATVTEQTDNSGRHPEGPGIGSVTINGPYAASGPGDTPSRRRIFVCRPSSSRGDEACARQILSTVTRRAFRRPVANADIEPLMAFYRQGKAAGDFETGVQTALERVLIDPEFLFRFERDTKSAPGAIHRLTDLELASRLSFFLWSSIPDDELLSVAEQGRLSDPATLDRQVRRMLADGRSNALVTNFFGQWLQLRSMKGVAPDPNLFPEFDEGLREAFERETDLFLEAQIREDRGIPEMISANYTFLNERLARHYQVPGVSGSRYRKVVLDDERRGGLLGQGSILTVTSYGNRTSPVLRAKWLLENLLGTPPPAPPGNVPPFPDERGANGEPRSVRERLSTHRKNPVCANCHAPMDPLGFALENFDAVGKWRTIDANAPVDASAQLVDGTTFAGPGGLRKTLMDRRTRLVHTAAEKMLTYAIGRGLESYDSPVLRGIERQAAASDYKWSALVLGIVKSTPFQMRRSES